jgi:hypothetical protein
MSTANRIFAYTQDKSAKPNPHATVSIMNARRNGQRMRKKALESQRVKFLSRRLICP